MNNKSTHIQVYNESKKQSKNLLVYHSKTAVAFYIFWLTRKKTRINPNILNLKVYEYIWKISENICPKTHEKS